MNNFVVSALKYRPSSFDNVIGQSSITKTLENAIKQNQLPQALLFCGPRGVGKTTCARILAKKINKKEDESNDFSFNIFELDAASNNGVDDIRNLIDQVRIPPQSGKYKVYIIDEVHMLSGQAFNAFLKTLEEPPSYAIFILATTEKHKVIPTILSRCQIYDFKKISTDDIKVYLEKIANVEKIQYEEEALYLIAKKSDGALRDALSIFDRLINFTEGNITKQLAYENLNVLDYDTYFLTYEYLIKNDITNVLLLLNEVIEKGFDGQHYIDGFSTHLRDLMVAKNSSTHILLEQNDILSKKYVEQSKIKPVDFILQAIDLTQECSYRYKSSKNQRLLVEICLMKLCSISQIELKKKIIILPSSIIEKQESIPQKNNGNQIDSELPSNNIKKEEKIEEINIKLDKEKIISGLSISSLKIKKDIEKKKKIEKQSKELENLKELFNEEDLEREWKIYYTNLLKNGKKNLASILQIDQPKIKNKSEIHFTLSNNTNKIELEKNKFGLVNFLKERLRNNKIELFINVNKEKEKKFIYSTMEKFEKLKSINNSIEKMRKEFKLGL
tara:strand:- start:836 stop:2512 length:1677 start_codon:yes stop_codon:yes gene_type:complete